MIFPELGPTYYDERDRGILSRMQASYAEAITILQSFWSEADTDLRFYNNDQSLWSDLYGNLAAMNRRRNFTFNKIRPIVNMVDGHQRRNRKSFVVMPFENADAYTADQFTKVLMYCAKRDGILETFSEATLGSLITGMNFLSVWLDYREDPVNGNIRVDNCPYNTFLVDPYFKKADFSDAQFIWKRTFLTKRECISLLPQHAEEILGLTGNDTGVGRDGKFQFQPESYNYGMKNLLTYDEYWYRDYRKQKLLVDVQTGDTLEWRNQDQEALKNFLQLYPQINVIEQDVATTNLAIVVQNKVFYHGPNPMGIDRYPFVPVFCYYHPESPYYPWRVQGMVRGLRDSQYLYNRRKIIELDILESQINSGFKYKENALVNPKDIFLQGQGRGLALKEEAAMTDVEQILPPNIPPTTLQVSESLGKELMSISGVNEELMGSAIDDKAGILSMLRQGAGLTTLQGLFDQWDYAQKQVGQIMMDIIQANWTPGKIKKILEGEEPAPLFYNKAFGKYHASVEEGMNTATQRQMQMAQLMELRNMGLPIPDDAILEAATIQNKKELMDRITQNQQQAQQMQQQQAQVAMEEIQSRIKLAQARATADQGLGLERVSRVQENQALAIERQAAAKKDEDIALLNLVKALKEIENVDLAQLEKLIALSKMVKPDEIQPTS